MPLVFGYGSLVNRQLRGPFLRDWPARFRAPFRRTWNAHCLSQEGIHYTALGLEPVATPHAINGVVFEVTDTRYAQLLEREKGYYVHTAHIDYFEWQTADRPVAGPISVFVICDPQRPTVDYPINLQYLHNCAEGFRDLGSVALDEFMESLVYTD
jgi:hypothetical protein